MRGIGRAWGVAALVVALAIGVSGCGFVARSDFYVRNESGLALLVSWDGNLDGKEGSSDGPIGPDQEALLVTGRLLEADELLPSEFFGSIRLERVEPFSDPVEVFYESPVDDDRWERTVLTGTKRYRFTFVVTTGTLGH